MSKIKGTRSLVFPEGFHDSGRQMPKESGFMAGAEVFQYESANTSAAALSCVVDPKIAMDFNDTKGLIDDLHASMEDNSGLIEVKAGVNRNGQKYIYHIRKFYQEDEDHIPLGMIYMLNMNMQVDQDIWFVSGHFQEDGTTGIRDNMVACIESQNGIKVEDPNSGWFKDPYDPSYTKGLRMNLSEQEKYDEMFPEHPLSELRKFKEFVLDNNPNTGRRGIMGLDLKRLGNSIDVAAITGKAKENIDKIDMEALKEKSAEVSKYMGDKAVEVKDAALKTKDDLEAKITELDTMLAESITEYNNAFTLMNDKGVQLYVERCRATDSIENIENLINSIANHPKNFDKDFEEINTERAKFLDTCEYADQELKAARTAAAGAGAGLAAGASVAFMAPTAAMWVATTFGTASTGAAISTLSGAAASNAALAWLGGGALAAGGHGIAGGSALLALAGPIGWGIAGATLLTSILLFAKSRTKLNKQKNEEIEEVKKNTERVKEMDAKIGALLSDTNSIRTGLNRMYTDCLKTYGGDYNLFSGEQKIQLGNLVNNTKVLSAMFGKTVS